MVGVVFLEAGAKSRHVWKVKDAKTDAAVLHDLANKMDAAAAELNANSCDSFTKY